MYEINMDGTGEREVFDTYNGLGEWVSPARMAIDPSTGNIYYIGLSWFGFIGDSFIGVISPNLTHTHLPISQEMASPRDLVLDPERGLLFWVDIRISNTGVFRANMDGSASEQLVDGSEVEGIAGVALDTITSTVYFTDGYTDDLYSIPYTGGEMTHLMQEPGSSYEDVALMMWNGRKHLFYTAWNVPFINSYTLNSGNGQKKKLHSETPLGRLDAIDIYRSTYIPKVHTDCARNNGGCSHFCLPKGVIGHTCACEDGYGLLPGSTTTCENVPRCLMGIGNATLSEECIGLPGDICGFTCNKNFRLKTGVSDKTTCKADLNWDQESPCEEILCPATVPNGGFATPCSNRVDSVCTGLTCNAGFEPLAGVDAVVCQEDGMWNTSESLLCEPKCPTGVVNGNLSSTCNRDPRDNCGFTCRRTYKPRDNNTRVICDSNSMWDRDITMVCEEIFCPRTVGNAVFVESCTRKVDEHCLYRCDNNFTINTNAIYDLQCQLSGNWKNLNDPNMELCLPPVLPQPESNKFEVTLGVTLSIIAILIIILVVLACFLARRRDTGTKGFSMPTSSRSMTYHIGSTRGEGSIGGIENPQYQETHVGQGGAAEGMKDFNYATLDDDKIDLTETKNGGSKY